MKDHYTYTEVVWMLLSRLSIILALSSMIFLTMNCLRCLFRWQSARIDDTELLLDIQLEQIQEIAIVECDTNSTTISSTKKSDISEPIITGVVIPSTPGKPKATKVIHDSVYLEWTKPEQGVQNIISYTVLYRSTADNTWREHKAGVAVTVIGKYNVLSSKSDQSESVKLALAQRVILVISFRQGWKYPVSLANLKLQILHTIALSWSEPNQKKVLKISSPM